MRKAILALAVSMACMAWGQALGTKPDLVSSAPASASGVNFGELGQMAVALLIVGFLVKWGLPKWLKRLERRPATAAAGGAILFEEAANWGPVQLQVVSLRGRTLLLGAAGSAVTCLAELTEKAEPAPKAFLDFVDQAEAGVEEAEDKGMSMDEAISIISAAQARLRGDQGPDTPLDRLARLTGH